MTARVVILEVTWVQPVELSQRRKHIIVIQYIEVGRMCSAYYELGPSGSAKNIKHP